MTNILLVTSSPRGPQSLSTRFARDIAESLNARSGGTIVERDLGAAPLPHITAAYSTAALRRPRHVHPNRSKPSISLKASLTRFRLPT